MTAALRAPPSLGARLRRVIGILLVFVLAGPIFGGLTFLFLAFFATPFGQVSQFDPGYELTNSFSPPYLLLIGGLAISYAFGTGPLAVAGLAIGIKQAFFGPATWWMALAAGLVAGVVFLDGVGFELGDVRYSGSALPQAVPILTGVVATVLCWLLVRNWHFAAATEVAP